MKTSEFTDKKVTELSRSQSEDFSELSYSHGRDLDDADSDSAFQFLCARPGVSSESYGSDFQNRSEMDFCRMRAGSENIGNFHGGALISVIDRKMEEYSANLLHAVESLGVRLCQLETRTRKIEYSMDEFKSSSDLNHRTTEHKLTDLGNVLSELQAGIRDLRDKQEISEMQIEVAKLKILKDHKQSGEEKSKVNATSGQPMSSSGQLPTLAFSPIQLPVASSANHLYSIPPNQPTSSLPCQQFQNSSNQSFPRFPTNSPPHQMPLTHNVVDPQSRPLPTQNLLPHRLPLTQHPVDSQARPFPTHNIPPHQSPLAHNPVDPHARPLPTQNFPPHQLPLTQNTAGPQSRPSPTQNFPPHQQYLIQNLGDPQSRPSLTGNFPPHQQPLAYNPVDSQAYPSPAYNTNTRNLYNAPPALPFPEQLYLRSRSSEFRPGHVQPSRDSNFRDEYSQNHSAPKPRFPQSPNPQVLPRALPMATEVSSGSGPGGARTSTSADDVTENVVAMGFRRDLVRAMVKKLTEDGQTVDLNVVLDKLLNG